MSDDDRRPIAIGKRVRLTGRHPWAGQWGWIVERLGSYAADRLWVVEMPDQGGHQVGASEREMETYRRDE